MAVPASELTVEMGGASRGRRGWSNADRFRVFDGKGQKLLLAHVGDCRAYRVRGEVIVQLTTDHTLPKHPQVLMRALGIPDPVEPDAGHSDCAVGDRFILCTDGVHRSMGDDELRALAVSDAPARAAEKIVTKARANGSDDDATCVILLVRAT